MFSFSNLFGNNVENVSPQRSIATTNLSSSTSTATKHNPTNDRMKSSTTAREEFALEKSIDERFENKTTSFRFCCC